MYVAFPVSKCGRRPEDFFRWPNFVFFNLTEEEVKFLPEDAAGWHRVIESLKANAHKESNDAKSGGPVFVGPESDIGH